MYIYIKLSKSINNYIRCRPIKYGVYIYISMYLYIDRERYMVPFNHHVSPEVKNSSSVQSRFPTAQLLFALLCQDWQGEGQRSLRDILQAINGMIHGMIHGMIDGMFNVGKTMP